MAPSKKTVKKVNVVAASTDITACDPPLNDDGNVQFAQPDVQSETDIRKILVDTEKCYKLLQGKHVTLTLNLNKERSKNSRLRVKRLPIKRQ